MTSPGAPYRFRGWTVIEWSDDLDLSSAPRLRQLVVAQLQAGERYLALDLSRCDFIDSVGLGILVAALKRTRTHDGELAVVTTNPRIVRLVDLVELRAALGLVARLDELDQPV